MTELWIALVLTWTPMVERVVDKEFTSEKQCWDYYETEIAPNTTLGEGKWGSQVLTAQNTRPDKNYFFKTNNNYPRIVFPQGSAHQPDSCSGARKRLARRPRFSRGARAASTRHSTRAAGVLGRSP